MSARVELGLSGIPDKVNEILVTKIVELGKTESDADKICERGSMIYVDAAVSVVTHVNRFVTRPAPPSN